MSEHHEPHFASFSFPRSALLLSCDLIGDAKRHWYAAFYNLLHTFGVINTRLYLTGDVSSAQCRLTISPGAQMYYAISYESGLSSVRASSNIGNKVIWPVLASPSGRRLRQGSGHCSLGCYTTVSNVGLRLHGASVSRSTMDSDGRVRNPKYPGLGPTLARRNLVSVSPG